MTDIESEQQPRKTSAASASHVIAGFRYQLLQSIAALLGLKEGEKLLLEVSEDFSIAATNAATDVQVKNSQAAAGPPKYSLQSSEVRAAISRFWQTSEQAGSIERRLIFLARGGVATERDYSFPDNVAGLLYWKAAAIDADTGPVRDALKALFSEHPLGKWIESNPDDDEFRQRLLRRVNWQLEALPADALVIQTRDQLSSIYYSKGLPVAAAGQAVNSLIALAFEVASRPNAKDRILDRLDLSRVLEEVAGTALVAGRMVQAASAPAPLVEDILVTESEAVPIFLARRSTTVRELGHQTRGQPLIWLHGSHGVGKSTLGRLMAQSLGGRWITLDLRPVHKDSVASTAAWRELLRVLAAGGHPDGIIIDDFTSVAADALRSRLAALVRTVGARGARVIVTSHQAPSPAHLLEFGAGTAGIIQAPYFSEVDTEELVRMSPAPDPEMARAWSMMLQMTTGGGQPVLVATKVASLRARGWPTSALVEDFGSPSEAVQLTREEARLRLLRDLQELDDARSLDAGQLLRRAACLFDRAEPDLIRKLAQASPALVSGTDALSLLRGTWLEILPHGDLRISPLLTDLASDVPPEDAKRWRQIAAEHWLAKRILNERTLPLCFWNAYWGEHGGVLMKLCQILQTMPREKLRAAAPLLAPMTALVTCKSIYTAHPLVGVYLRLLQFEIADAVEQTEVAGRIAERLLEEIDELGGDTAVLLTTVAAPQVLMASSARLTPRLRLKYTLRLREAFPIAERLSDGQIHEKRSLLPVEFAAEMDLSDFLFASVVQHISGSEDALDTFSALNELPAGVRNRFVDAISVIFQGPSVLVSSGWSHDQLSDRDMEPSLQCYMRVADIVAGWDRPDIEAEVFCAKSVILDEGLKRNRDALLLIDSAISKLGNLPALIRQKAKILAHDDEHAAAADLLLSIEDKVGLEAPLERALALRDGGISAAKAGRFRDAARLFDKARETLGSQWSPLATALLVEKGLALWRSGDKIGAITVSADALEAVEAFGPDETRQAERSHQFARALVGLFFSELAPENQSPSPPFTFGQASVVELESAELIGARLKSLADNWRILAAVEANLGLNAGIDARSMDKQSGPLSILLETQVRKNKYVVALRSGDLERALRAGADLINVSNTIRGAEVDEDGVKRAEAWRFIVSDEKSVLTDDTNDAVQAILLDILLTTNAAQEIDQRFLNDLNRACTEIFGDVAAIRAVLDAAISGHRVSADDSRAEMLARGIILAESDVAPDPATRSSVI